MMPSDARLEGADTVRKLLVRVRFVGRSVLGDDGGRGRQMSRRRYSGGDD